MDTVSEKEAKKIIKLFLRHIDRTVLDSFAHADIGPVDSRAGRIIMEAEAELEDAVPNISMKYDEDKTSDEYAIKAIECALKCAKPCTWRRFIYVMSSDTWWDRKKI